MAKSDEFTITQDGIFINDTFKGKVNSLALYKYGTYQYTKYDIVEKNNQIYVKLDNGKEVPLEDFLNGNIEQ